MQCRRTEGENFLTCRARSSGVVVWPLPKSETSGLAAVLQDHSWPLAAAIGASHMHSADSIELRPSQFSLRAARKGD